MHYKRSIKSKKKSKRIGIVIMILTFIGVISISLVFTKRYSIIISINKKTVNTISSNNSSAKDKDITDKEQRVHDNSMSVFYRNNGKFDMAKDKIDEIKVESLMKVFNSSKLVSIYAEATPLSLGAICLSSIDDRGIAAEMIRRLNGLPSINTVLKDGVEIAIPYIH